MVAAVVAAVVRMTVRQVILEQARKVMRVAIVYPRAALTAQAAVVWDLLDPMRLVQTQVRQVERVLRIPLEEVLSLLRVEEVEADTQEEEPLLAAQGLEARVLWPIRVHEVAMAP
jgi:hypothetical protein